MAKKDNKTLSLDEPAEKAVAENKEPKAQGEDLLTADEASAEAATADEHEVFIRVSQAYEEAKRKRDGYKKFGPFFVFITGVIFLTLIFTLENKITFLIFWVITVLYTVALMIRSEYKYHRFQYYLGIVEEKTDEEYDDELIEEEKDIQEEEQI